MSKDQKLVATRIFINVMIIFFLSSVALAIEEHGKGSPNIQVVIDYSTHSLDELEHMLTSPDVDQETKKAVKKELLKQLEEGPPEIKAKIAQILKMGSGGIQDTDQKETEKLDTKDETSPEIAKSESTATKTTQAGGGGAGGGAGSGGGGGGGSIRIGGSSGGGSQEKNTMASDSVRRSGKKEIVKEGKSKEKDKDTAPSTYRTLTPSDSFKKTVALQAKLEATQTLLPKSLRLIWTSNNSSPLYVAWIKNGEKIAFQYISSEKKETIILRKKDKPNRNLMVIPKNYQLRPVVLKIGDQQEKTLFTTSPITKNEIWLWGTSNESPCTKNKIPIKLSIKGQHSEEISGGFLIPISSKDKTNSFAFNYNNNVIEGIEVKNESGEVIKQVSCSKDLGDSCRNAFVIESQNWGKWFQVSVYVKGICPK